MSISTRRGYKASSDAKEDTYSLESFQIELLKKKNFRKYLNIKYILCEAVFDQNSIKLTGSRATILSAKDDVKRFVSSIRTTEVTLSSPLRELFRTRKMDLNKILKEWRVVAVWEITSTSVKISAYSDYDLEFAELMFRNEFTEQTIALEGPGSLLVSEEWKSLRENLIDKHQGMLFIETKADGKSLIVACRKGDAGYIVEQINRHLTARKVSEKKVKLSSDMYRLLTTHLEGHWKQIEDNSVPKPLTITFSDNCYKVCGTETALEKALRDLKKLSDSVIKTTYEIKKLGMLKIFHKENGKSRISILEQEYRVIVNIPNLQTDLCKFARSLENGKTINIAKGSIVGYPVEVIVNPANAELNHSGGLAANIVRTGGAVIQEECNDYVKKQGKLKTGENFPSTAGNLPHLNIIHVLGPIWRNGQKGEKDQLADSITGCLWRANDLKVKSIALPLISAGISGFPLAESVSITIEAIEMFLIKQNTSLQDVHVVDISDEAVQDLKIFLGEKYKYDVMIPSMAVGGTTEASVQSLRSLEPFTGGMSSVKPFIQRAAGPIIREYANGSKLSLIKGNIVAEKTEVIVNTTGTSLRLGNAGAVSLSIMKAAGDTMQKECDTKYPKGIKEGEFAVTSAGELNSKFVFHVACPSWNFSREEECKTAMEKLVLDLLQKLDSYRLKSISLPALGTGGNSFPRHIVAKSMLQEIDKFFLANPSTSVKEVRLIVYDKDTETIEVFRETFQETAEEEGTQDEEIEEEPGRIQQNISSLDLTIYATSEESIEMVKRGLDQFCAEEYIKKEVNNPLVPQLIKTELDRIAGKGDELDVGVTVSGEIITLEGVPRRVMVIKDDIDAILQQKLQENLLIKAKWAYMDETKEEFVQYSININAMIENAYNDRRPTADWGTSTKYKITFATMQETSEGRNNPTQVKRSLPEILDLPPTWCPSADEDVFAVFEVKPESDEYWKVEANFKADVPDVEIKRIERIQNKTLYGQYQNKKKNMVNPEEKHLYHGTSADAIASINANGFNRRLCGKNATMYGKGAYFAVSAKYSACYSQPDENQEKRIYQCKVLTGKYTQGVKDMIVPPAIDKKYPHILYDSVVDDMSKPEMFVVFTDSQCYPEYLISFTKKDE